MSFDIKTVFTLFFIADIAIGAFLSLYRILININARWFNLYILGKFLQAVSILFYAIIRDDVPYSASILAGNIPAIFGISLETYSFTIFGNQRIKNKIWLFLSVAGIGALIFALNIYNSLHIRVILVFVTYSSLFVLSAIIMVRTKPLTKLKASTGGLLFLIALFGIYRCLDAIIIGDQIQLFYNRASEIASFLVYFLVSYVLTINFIFLFKEEDEKHLKMLSDIVEQNPASIMVTNLEGNLEYVNKAFCDTTGHSINEAIGQNPRILQSGLVKREIYKELWDKLTHGKTWHGEFINKTKEGELFYEDAFIAPTFNNNGTTVNYFGIKHNITDKKKAENALRLSEENLLKAQSIAKIGHWSLDILHNKFVWSDEVYKIYEINKDEFTPAYKDFIEFIHPEDKERVDTAFKESIANKSKFEVTHKILLRNGKIKYVHEQCDTNYTEKGIPVNSIGTVQDVTEKEEAHHIIMENEQALDRYFRANPIPVAVLDFETTRYVKVNEAYTEIINLPAEEIMGKTPADLSIITEERLLELKKILKNIGKVEHARGTITSSDGKIYDVVTYAELVETRGRKMVYTTSVDLTELNVAKKQLEISNKKLVEALDDKNVLLKEVHHRVKNNLQTIGSLLFKQQRITNEKEVKLVLQDSINRITSIALINEQIYRSENFREIDLSKQIHDIVQHLLVAYQQPDKKILVAEKLEKVMLSIEKALPCSLIVNEIISNSLKHGFLHQTNGNIHIELKNLNDSTVLLKITDDGVGLPEGFSHASTDSLGMFIIFNLSKRQLFGDLDIISNNGTQFTIKFEK